MKAKTMLPATDTTNLSSMAMEATKAVPDSATGSNLSRVDSMIEGTEKELSALNERLADYDKLIERAVAARAYTEGRAKEAAKQLGGLMDAKAALSKP
jgi:septal ring factor EnvC (AmiA/AmiB activator)